MFKDIVIFALIGLVGVSEAVTLPGQCDTTIAAVQNFDAGRFLGTWYEMSSYPSPSALGECNTAMYSLNTDGSVAVVNSQVVNQTLEVISGFATLSGTDAVLDVTLEVVPGVFAQQQLLVLATDYTSYAVSYSCVNSGTTQKEVFAWIVSRTKTLPAEAQTAVNQVIASFDDLIAGNFVASDHSEAACFYLPELAVGESMLFPGNCDAAIQGVANFNIDRFVGSWYEVQSYPTPWHSGTCNKVVYSVSGSQIGIDNTQVINETLDVYSTPGVIVSEDGSAKLSVSIPFFVGDISIFTATDYWILATDYDSYALIYACQDEGDGRRVWSSKLSRTNTLANTAAQAITNVVNQIDVLDEQYYLARENNAQSCFYFPEFVAGESVKFPGQCEDTISAQANFDMSRFVGTWYEIETYSKVGECASVEYTLTSTTTLSYTSSRVNRQLLNTASGTVAFSSTDGTGRLIVTENGVQSPLFILATDYDDYALAYRCVNLDSSYRSILSYKLSRSQTLSAAAVTAINQRISDIVVLNDVYYETTDHSESGCFYLPESLIGEPVILGGQCEDNPIVAMSNFDVARYLGRWRQVESYPSPSQYGSCADSTLTLEDGSVVVYNTEVINQTLDYLYGTAALVSTDGSANLDVTFPIEVADSEISVVNLRTVPYWVVDTDYDTYSLVYSCVNINAQQQQILAWKLSRTDTLSEEALANIDRAMEDVAVLNNMYFLPDDRSPDACFYYPEPTGEPVVFRGQCNESLPTVQNFDAVAYMGLWHEIEGYPSVFQQGQCNNAFYTLVGTTVDVYNTQVVNEALDEITGLALLASDDGSAKLDVFFPIAGTSLFAETTYWVLDTDYTDYSLVYTCENINQEERRIWSWKLSRSQSLSANAASAINNAMSSVDVLDQRYFNQRDQSTEACFYWPEAVAGTTARFRGTCDAAIETVTNFDVNRFSGTWYEISAYPNELQTGSCVSYNISVVTNSLLTVTYTRVENFDLTVNTTTLTRAAGVTDGRFTTTMVIDGEVQEIPFWILATDYDNYALAYGCVTFESPRGNTRAVFSWRLGRSQTLPLTSNNEINAVTSNIDVLDDRLYLSSGQDSESCFYLPNLSLDEPVIFPGQCNLTIQAMPNFDATRYTGQWYDIESYYDEFQQGSSCNDALYTLNPAGYVDVYNTQVVNELLDTITGTAVVASTDGSGKLEVEFPIAGTDFNITAEYWILDTDYDSYSLVYSCRNLDNNRQQLFSWKLSRSRALTDSARAAIDAKMAEVNVLNQQYYIPRDHTPDGCFYYPEPVAGQAVIFRSLCDETVQVQQNFDAARYMGTWYDVGSYPQEFQFGSCPTATYALNTTGGFVEVYNTQVVNQKLDEIYGTAVPDSIEPAKLTVTFPIAGTELTIDSPYWILTTDYDNYALVYTCLNVGPENSRVTSWMLSRQPTLSTTSAQAIAAVTNNVRVLDEMYYVNRGHTEEDCFFYPENNGGPVILSGTCNPNQNVVQNFLQLQFSGFWYEVAYYPSMFSQGVCTSSQYLASAGGFSVRHYIIDGDTRYETIVRVSIPLDGSGSLVATFEYPQGVTQTLPLYVLDTDYTSYALLMSCQQIDTNTKQIYSWKLSRNRAGLSQTALNNINAIINSTLDLYEGYYQTADQSEEACFYYPNADEIENQVVLPGECPNNITAIPNFNAAGYLGRWYEHYRFPVPNQFGDCARAEYSLGDGVVDVLNSEVFNQTLFLQPGFATAAADGTGQLEVTFVVNGVTVQANYYVLATDYNNYALVYSCRNLGDGNRQVSSWKLSRNPTWNAAYDSIFAPIIEATEGLREEYYREVPQTQDACFYVPEEVDNEVVFRGQCGTVSGLQGFDASRYVGWWHEISAYPTPANNGVCVSSEIESSGNQYSVVDTGVFGLTAQVNSYTLQMTTDGRLIRTNANGQTSEVLVLATDYDSYSVLYSCENIDDEYMRVWSAKHSKSRSLTAAAESAIAAVIASNDQLVERFYVPVDQSDLACFHYPEQSGNRVLMPGQCDLNIPVVQNFDAAAYTGTWYQIEKYPQQWENGTCIGARYTLDENTGIVTLVNWQVIDGEIDSLEGTAVISSTDGSAKLRVTLPVVGTDLTTEYDLYVLTTDYVSYSLAYSCENIGQYRRAVGAWKISRTRTMPAAGNTAINQVINSREELHQPYFTITEQDEECPEPSSAAAVQTSIVALLVCALLQYLR